MKALFKKIGRSLKGASSAVQKAGAAEEKPKAGLGGGGFKGLIRRAVAGAQKAGSAEAKPKAGLGGGIGAIGKALGAAAAKRNQFESAKLGSRYRVGKNDEKDGKMDAKPFENGGAVKKASSKGRGMGAATQGGGAVGGAAKKKGYAMGGMAMKKGYAAGGPAMKKGYAMGGAAMKKGYASGGSARSK